jgi:O-antigen ligase
MGWRVRSGTLRFAPLVFIATGLSLAAGALVPAQAWWIIPTLVLILLSSCIVAMRPFAVIPVFICIVSGLFDLNDRVGIPIAQWQDAVELRELVAAVILLLVSLQFLRAPEKGRVIDKRVPSLFTPTVLFLGWGLLSVPLTILRGAPLHKVLVEMVPWFLYMPLPLLLPRLVKTRRDWGIAVAAFLSCTLLTAALTLGHAFGNPQTELVSLRKWSLTGHVRIQPENHVMMLTSFGVLVAHSVIGERRSHRALCGALAFLVAIGLFVSVSRTIIVVEIIVLVLSVWWAGRHRRARGAVVTAALIGFVLVFVSLVGRNSGVSFLDVAVSWFKKVIGPQARYAGTIVGRVMQYRAVLDTLLRSPVWGVGWGGRFIDPVVHEYAGARYAYVVHNGYLQVAVKLGVPGLLAFLYWLHGGLADAHRVWAGTNGWTRAVATGLLSGLVAYLLVSTLVAWGVGAAALAQLGIVLGLAESYLVLMRNG